VAPDATTNRSRADELSAARRRLAAIGRTPARLKAGGYLSRLLLSAAARLSACGSANVIGSAFSRPRPIAEPQPMTISETDSQQRSAEPELKPWPTAISRGPTNRIDSAFANGRIHDACETHVGVG
jgi:hypothetical protein